MNLLGKSFLLLQLFRINAEVLDVDDGSNNVCYICFCNAGKNTVDCSQRGLKSIPDGVSHAITTLNMSSNDIYTFPTNLNRFYNLKSLDLSDNWLSQIPANAFQNLTALEVLNLSRNNFEAWSYLNPNEILQPATSLKILDLSYNRLQTLGNLGTDELLYSHSLETLILDYCDIDSIHGRSPLSGLTNIRVLKLNNNPLVKIDSLISPTLKSLYISYCLLRYMNYDFLYYLPSLIHLKMTHNFGLELSSSTNTLYSSSLQYLDISYSLVHNAGIQGFSNLKKAVLNHNIIRFLPSNAFINNSKLEYLDLSYNNIGSVKSDTFRGLTAMKYLDLTFNEIAVIPENTLLEMPSLTKLKVAKNYLTEVGHLKSLSLTVLNISNCEINVISKDSLEGLKSLVHLDLSHNIISHIPDSISSNTLKYLNLNYNRIRSIGNLTFFMLPRLTTLRVVGNRFTNVWRKSYFDSNAYLEKLDLADNMWRCDCDNSNMFDFYEFVTLEPNKKEESYNLKCDSPSNVMGQTWLEACYSTWNPSNKVTNADGIIWFLIVMIVGLALCIILVSTIRKSMNRRLVAIQRERERHIEEASDRLRQLRIRAEQEALCNTPDPRDLIAPPSYDEALSMPKLNASSCSLCETESGKSKKRSGRRKTKSSGDLLQETERNGEFIVVDDLELTETSRTNRRRRRRRSGRRYDSHEIAELDQSPGVHRRRTLEYGETTYSVTVDVESETLNPLCERQRRYSDEVIEPKESDF